MAPSSPSPPRQYARPGAAGPFTTITPVQLFVLSRGMIGVIRAAVMEEQAFFTSRAFEDELVRLVMAYLDAITADGRGQRRTTA